MLCVAVDAHVGATTFATFLVVALDAVVILAVDVAADVVSKSKNDFLQLPLDCNSLGVVSAYGFELNNI